jgi:hypothetical protein
MFDTFEGLTQYIADVGFKFFTHTAAVIDLKIISIKVSLTKHDQFQQVVNEDREKDKSK